MILARFLTPVLVALCAPALLAQQPPWAKDKFFDLKDVELTLFRPGCFGNCASYTVTISGIGQVTYSGDALTYAQDGKFKTELTATQVYELLNLFLRVQFFELPDQYDSGATAFEWPPQSQKFRIVQRENTLDNTFTELRLTIGKHTKTVRLWNSYSPPELEQIGDRIDELAGTVALPDLAKQE